MSWVKYEVKTTVQGSGVLTHVHYEPCTKTDPDYLGAMCREWALEIDDVQMAMDQLRPFDLKYELIERPPREFCIEQIQKLDNRIRFAQSQIEMYRDAMK